MRLLLSGFVLGGTVMWGVFEFSTRRTPATPTLRPPTAIEVTLYPWADIRGIDCVPVDIPPETLEHAFRLLSPETHYGFKVDDFVVPIVAEATLSHADGTQTFMLVRDHGHNPAVVTVDGEHYFSARNDPDVYAGAIELIQMVKQLAQEKDRLRQPNP